ncbi:tRNA adenosine(34) deaminase TadA [Vandammella animalimorsus]|uniref:tRNA adenosine(34) deaminase TadA n=1 Tax=Vandammella animalimorsus TaxID=2029117 RepID=UPI0031BBB6EC
MNSPTPAPMPSPSAAAMPDAGHAHWMRLALAEAEQAAAEGEVPVGAVLVRDGQLLARNHNRTRQLADPSAHAEMLALREGAARLGNHRMGDCTLYVTLEPCAMCSGAVFQARLACVVFGASEPKTGAAGSVLDLFAHPGLNHHTQLVRGVLADECAALLEQFFQQRRRQQAQASQPLRDDALRTPEACFAPCPAAGHYSSALPELQGLRLHYQYLPQSQSQSLPQGLPNHPPAQPAQPCTALLLLHPPWHWSAWWAPLLQALPRGAYPALAPDLVGWGRSDKPKKSSWHAAARHARILLQLLDALGLRQFTLVSLEGAGPSLAPALLQALAQAEPARLAGWLRLLPAQGEPDALEPLWPIASGHMDKRWCVAAHLRRCLPTGADQELLLQAAAPYPSAAHARHWLATQLQAPANVASHSIALPPERQWQLRLQPAGLAGWPGLPPSQAIDAVHRRWLAHNGPGAGSQ